jgi:AcrR family transcriptional regulator
MGGKKTRVGARGVLFAQDRSRETLRRILDAALEVFAEKGYSATRVADIISRAGIGHGTFWLYFHNKEDLLRYLLQEMVDEFEACDWYREGDASIISVRSLEEVEEVIRGVMDIFARHAAIHPLIVRAAMDSEEFWEALEELNRPFVRIVESKLREHLEEGLCSGLDPEVTARIIVNLLEYANLQWMKEHRDGERDALIHNLSVIIHRTLNHNPAPPTSDTSVHPPA